MKKKIVITEFWKDGMNYIFLKRGIQTYLIWGNLSSKRDSVLNQMLFKTLLQSLLMEL